MVDELVTIYLRSRRMRKLSGKKNDASPILPLIIMDSAYQTFCKYVMGEYRHEMKRAVNEWRKTYTMFNRAWFGVYTWEQADYIIDMMAAFEKFIGDDMTVCWVQIMNLFAGEPLERQKKIGALMLVSIYCQCAEIVWERIYGEKNNQIISLWKLTTRMENIYYDGDRNINPNESKEVSACIDILCRKQVRFLRKYYEE